MAPPALGSKEMGKAHLWLVHIVQQSHLKTLPTPIHQSPSPFLNSHFAASGPNPRNAQHGIGVIGHMPPQIVASSVITRSADRTRTLAVAGPQHSHTMHRKKFCTETKNISGGERAKRRRGTSGGEAYLERRTYGQAAVQLRVRAELEELPIELLDIRHGCRVQVCVAWISPFHQTATLIKQGVPFYMST